MDVPAYKEILNLRFILTVAEYRDGTRTGYYTVQFLRHMVLDIVLAILLNLHTAVEFKSEKGLPEAVIIAPLQEKSGRSARRELAARFLNYIQTALREDISLFIEYQIEKNRDEEKDKDIILRKPVLYMIVQNKKNNRADNESRQSDPRENPQWRGKSIDIFEQDRFAYLAFVITGFCV